MTKIVWINNGKEYEIVGLFGCWAKSLEGVTINEGDVRMIAGELMYAYSIKRSSIFDFVNSLDEVSWVSVREKVQMEDIRTWKKGL